MHIEPGRECGRSTSHIDLSRTYAHLCLGCSQNSTVLKSHWRWSCQNKSCMFG
jgi:hypothetical protein